MISRFQRPIEHLGNDLFTLRPNQLVVRLIAPFEDQQARNAGDAVLDSDAFVVIDIKLADLDAAGKLRGNPINRRGQGPARPAPRRPEIDEHGFIAVDHLLLPVRLGELHHVLTGHALPPFICGRAKVRWLLNLIIVATLRRAQRRRNGPFTSLDRPSPLRDSRRTANLTLFRGLSKMRGHAGPVV